MKKLAALLAMAIASSGVAAMSQAALVSDFEATGTTGWTLTATAGGGMPALSTAEAHSGTQSLYVPAGGLAQYTLPNQGSGDLVMWVFDPGTATTLSTDYGPRWGITSPDGTAPFMVDEDKASGFGGGNYSAYYRAGSGGGLDVTDPTTLWSREASAGLGRISGTWTQYDFNINTVAGTMTVSTPSWTLGTTGSTVAGDNIPNNTAFSGTGSGISPEWVSVANGGTGPVGIGQVEIYGGNATSQFGGTFIDDVSWTPAAAPAPEPASLALLGLAAGAILLPRRRRI